MFQGMKRHVLDPVRSVSLVWLLLCVLKGTRLLAEPLPAAVSAFEAYAASVELRLIHQHQSTTGFLSRDGGDGNVRGGEPVIERVGPATGELVGALLHHWRGTAFAPGARAGDFERLMREFSAYPQHFSPQVVSATATVQSHERVQAVLRIRQRHVITVVMDTAYDVQFGQLDLQHGYSVSRSTRMTEIEAAGTAAERALGPGEEHGFLWRMNTYWSYEERDGGLYVQIESVSLSRSIPRGLGWVIRPYVESIPRESLEFTLRSACRALGK